MNVNPHPPFLVEEMDRAINELAKAVKAKDVEEVRQIAIAVALAALDFRMQYRPLPEIDHARLGVWASRAISNAEAKDPIAFTGDVAVLEWIWKRTGHNTGPEAAKEISVSLADMRFAATEKNLRAGLDAARNLQEALAAS